MRCSLLLLGALAPARGDLSLLAIGDWGGGSDGEPTTLSQRLTAQGMQRKAQELGADFTLLMGDNFYQHGIHECAEKSPRFHSTFEAVYAELLPGHAFYAIAGNHDYGEGRLSNVSSQVAYSQRSAQWRFPSLWYDISREFRAGNETRTLEILMIDTVVLCGNGPTNEGFIDEQLQFLGHKAEPGSPGALRRALAERQWAWLEARLAASSADFLWVSGHYPIWSAGNDGSTPCLIDRLKPMLLKYGAHYISGHDHMLEHFHHDGLDTFVVGAGKECCYGPVKLRHTPAGALRYMLAGHHGRLSQPPVAQPVRGGFASIRFDAEFAHVSFHADSGAELYIAPRLPRRSGSAIHSAAMSLHRVEQQMGPAEAIAVPLLLLALLGWALYPRLRLRLSNWHRQAAEPLLA